MTRTGLFRRNITLTNFHKLSDGFLQRLLSLDHKKKHTRIPYRKRLCIRLESGQVRGCQVNNVGQETETVTAVQRGEDRRDVVLALQQV